VTSGSHGDTLQFKISKLFIVLGEFTLTLENSNAYLSLVVCGS